MYAVMVIITDLMV